MSFPTGNNSNTKKYKFPVTPFSKRNDNRIAIFFKLRNIENDLNDWQKHQEAWINSEIITENKTGTVSYTTSNDAKQTCTIDIAKSGYEPVSVEAITTNNADVVVSGWDISANSATVQLTNIKHYLAALGVMTNATASSTSQSTLNTSATPNTVTTTTTTTITPTKVSKTAATVTITLKVCYRKAYTAYSGKQI